MWIHYRLHTHPESGGGIDTFSSDACRQALKSAPHHRSYLSRLHWNYLMMWIKSSSGVLWLEETNGIYTWHSVHTIQKVLNTMILFGFWFLVFGGCSRSLFSRMIYYLKRSNFDSFVQIFPFTVLSSCTPESLVQDLR